MSHQSICSACLYWNLGMNWLEREVCCKQLQPTLSHNHGWSAVGENWLPYQSLSEGQFNKLCLAVIAHDFHKHTQSWCITDWGSDEKLLLLGALREQCPKSDKISFSARGNKLDWQKVDVDGRTEEQCQAAWARMLAKVSTMQLCLFTSFTATTGLSQLLSQPQCTGHKYLWF